MRGKSIGFILIATLSFAIMNVFAKALSDFHPMQVVFFRATGTFVFIFPYMLFKGVSIVGNHPKQLFLRGIAGLISLATFFKAIQIIPLGSAISIRYIGPIFGAILATFFLNEKVNKWQWLSFFLAFSGVIVLKGFDVRISILGFMLSLISAFFIGIVFVLIRYLATREHYMTIINYFMVCCIVASLLFIGEWTMPDGQEWYVVCLIGVFGLIGQIFMTQAFSMAEASVLAPFKYMEIVYALIMGFVFFGEAYSSLLLVGIAMIIIGMVWNVLVKSKTA